MPQDETDEALMRAYGAGDAQAFRRLYARHADAVYRYCLRSSGSAAQAAEITQDVWMRVIEWRDRHVDQTRFRSWLFRIAHNRIVDHWREQARRTASDVNMAALDDGAPSAERRAHAENCADQLQTQLSTLPPEQRELILLREEGELTLEQMADLQGVGRETVKSRLRYALAKLKEALHDCLE